MHWVRKTIALAAIGACGVTAAGQEPQGRAVRLGMPTPLTSTGVVSAFVPIAPAGPALQPTSYGLPARPSVVRGVGPLLDDEPKQLVLPKELPPLDESKLIWPLLPTSTGKPERSTQPVQAADNKPKIIDVPEPPRLSLQASQADTIIIVDETGTPLFDRGFAGPNRFTAKGEWLLWWTRGFHLPPLVITDSAAVPLQTRGLLGNGTTQILHGDGPTSAGPNAGARFTLGYNLDPCGWCMLEASFFFLGRKNDNAFFSSAQYPVLGRPLFDLNDGLATRELTASPDEGPNSVFAAKGSVRIDTSSTLLGTDVNVRSLLRCGSNCKITGLAGFRYLSLGEHLGITEDIYLLRDVNPQLTPPDVPLRAGDHITVTDRFDTRNRFFGGQIGAAAEWQRNRWTFEAKFKLGIGATYQAVSVDGAQRIVSPNGQVQNFVGGLYGLPSNIGTQSQARFGVVPEVGLTVGYQLTDHISLFAGYDFLYWSSVLRPGAQIDQVLDLNQVPQSGRPYATAPQVRPRVPFQTSGYWAQGMNAGILFKY